MALEEERRPLFFDLCVLVEMLLDEETRAFIGSGWQEDWLLNMTMVEDLVVIAFG